MRKNQHITYKNGVWRVIGEGNSKPTKTFNTQEKAIEFGIGIAKNNNSEVVIHRKDNSKIRDKDSYGNDPHPPIDKKL